MYYFSAPQDFFGYGMLDFPVSMPGYAFSENPDQPILLHLVHTPAVPGLPPREQYRQGRATLLGMRFEDFEQHVVRQLQGMLGEYGFDAARDIAAITVNRWPHGYAYEYIDLYDPVDWGPDKGPHISGRTRCGRISIANSDSQALAYVNGAIDAAWRAVSEQLEQVGSQQSPATASITLPAFEQSVTGTSNAATIASPDFVAAGSTASFPRSSAGANRQPTGCHRYRESSPRALPAPHHYRRARLRSPHAWRAAHCDRAGCPTTHTPGWEPANSVCPR